MIPVLGVPFLNRPDLLVKMLQSIDEKVGEVVIVDNSDERLVSELSGPSKTRVISMGHNMGVAASWNLIMKATPLAPWWAIASSDIVFEPGALSRLSESMQDFDGLTYMYGMSAFAISKPCLSKAGWFDENFVPAYCEDMDYSRRCQLLNVPIKDLNIELDHVGSATIRSDKQLFEENNRTYRENAFYYFNKWGGGFGQPEMFETPFNKGGSPAEWHLDISRLAQLTWKTGG